MKVNRAVVIVFTDNNGKLGWGSSTIFNKYSDARKYIAIIKLGVREIGADPNTVRMIEVGNLIGYDTGSRVKMT